MANQNNSSAPWNRENRSELKPRNRRDVPRDLEKSTVGNPGEQGTIEVFAEGHTTAEEMFDQGQGMFTWIPNAFRIKLSQANRT